MSDDRRPEREIGSIPPVASASRAHGLRRPEVLNETDDAEAARRARDAADDAAPQRRPRPGRRAAAPGASEGAVDEKPDDGE